MVVVVGDGMGGVEHFVVRWWVDHWVDDGCGVGGVVGGQCFDGGGERVGELVVVVDYDYALGCCVLLVCVVYCCAGDHFGGGFDVGVW